MPSSQPLSDPESRDEAHRPGNTHAVYGLRQYWTYGHSDFDGDTHVIRIEWTGKARGKLERLAMTRFKNRDPDGVAVVPLRRTKTRVNVSTIPEAKALYGLLTTLLQRRTLTGHERSTYHRVRRELVDGVEQWDRLEIEDLHDGAGPADFERARERQRERADGSRIAEFEPDAF